MRLMLATIAWAAISESALWAQEPQRSYSLDGAWFGRATIAGIPMPVPFMDLIWSDSTNQGRTGTILCTLNVSRFQSPMGLVSITPSGHGTWVQIDKNKFAFTVMRILMDADAHPAGAAKFWGTLTAQANDTLTGTMNAEYYDPDGKASARFGGTTVETRIGPSLTASPNPIPVTGNALYGSTAISWSAPDAQTIEIHIGSPDGPLFTCMGNHGSAQTGNWVADGTIFYLQDVTGGKPLTSDYTLATLVVNLQKK